MKFFKVSALPALLAAAFLLLSAGAQPFRGGRERFGGNYGYASPEIMREQELMKKALVPGFEEDVFTFARLQFYSEMGYRSGGGRGWHDDSPEADFDLCYRLFQVTSLKIRPGFNVVNITTKELEQHPFVYVAGAGTMNLSDTDAAAMRRYLLNGGFMMVDDFWGDDQWSHFYEQIKKDVPGPRTGGVDAGASDFSLGLQFQAGAADAQRGDFF